MCDQTEIDGRGLTSGTKRLTPAKIDRPSTKSLHCAFCKFAVPDPHYALAGGLQGWLLRKTTLIERWMLIVAGLMLVYPAPLFDYIGFALVVVVIVSQKVRQIVVAPAAS